MKFSLRDILWVTALVAVALGWWIDRARRPEPVAAPPPTGRFQLFMAEGDTMVLDTATGALWSRPKSHASFYRADSPWMNRD